MPVYIITEHHGRKVEEVLAIHADNLEQALRLSCYPPLKMPPEARHWPFIDDGLGGGALIDPRDEDHCLRADPRDWDDDPCEGEAYGFEDQA